MRVPPKGPLPALRLRLTSVFADARRDAPLASCACTTTLKPAVATGLEPLFTVVIASWVGLVGRPFTVSRSFLPAVSKETTALVNPAA